MARLMALFFGLSFFAIGLLEYFYYPSDGLLFGYFEISSAYIKLHFVAGAFGLVSAAYPSVIKAYFTMLAFFYIAIAMIGYVANGDLSVVMMHANKADNLLHVVIGLIALHFAATLEE